MEVGNSAMRPNILVIVSDDQGAWAMSHAGTPEIHTPNLDRLAAWGKRFQALYCVSPVCSPARASLLTGRIPSAHGVHDWIRQGNSTVETGFHRRLVEYLDANPTYVELLAKAGYVCGLSGKWHLGNSHRPHRGFSFWEAFATGGGTYQTPMMIRDGEPGRQDGYLTDIITENALRFLAQQHGTAPWYLSVHYTAPHAPWEPEEHKPEDFARYYPDCAFASLPAPPMHPGFYNPAHFPADDDARRRKLAGYFAAVTAMDRGIGRILRSLRDDTLILFTSDNGMNMGHHGIYGKGNGTYPQNLFETSVRVPGILAWPGRVPPGTLTGLYSHYDVMPTLLGIAGVPCPAGLPGRDIGAVLLSEAPEEGAYVVVFDEYGPNRMIREGDWKYIQRFWEGEPELYDLAADPGETTNLAASPQHATVVARLGQLMDDWFACHGVPAMDGRGLKVAGGGQINRLDAGGGVFVDHADRLVGS